MLLILGIAPLLLGPSAALDLVLCRLLDALAESANAADFFCFILVTACEAESAASSPEASRDDGWRRSAVEDCLVELGRVEVRFLFPEPDDEGDDMAVWPIDSGIPEYNGGMPFRGSGCELEFFR